MAKAKYQQNKDGVWTTKVWDGTYVNGRKHRINITSKKSSKDLEQKVAEHNRKIEERQYVRTTNTTFVKYAELWVAAYKSHLEQNTVNMYENIVNKHFQAFVCPVGEMHRGLYVAVLNGVKGARTRQQFQMVFKQVVKSAIKDKLLPESVMEEFFEDTIKVKYNAPEKRALTEAEKEAVKKCTFKYQRDDIFLKLLYYTGMRGEEIRALTVFDVNFKKKEISVTKAVAHDKNDPIEKDTKNGIHRTIPMSDTLVTALEAYIKDLDGTKLFGMPDGKYMTKSSYTKMWMRVLAEIERNCSEPVRGLTPHIFRHNYCATLRSKIPEISIQRIAKLLGDSEKMVIEVYNHELAEKENVRDVVSEALAL